VDDNIRHVTSTDETNCKNEDTIEVQLNRELVRVTNSMEGHLARVVQELRDLQKVTVSVMKSMQRDVTGDSVCTPGAPLAVAQQSFSGLLPEVSAGATPPRIEHRETFASGCSPSLAACRL